MQTFFDQVLHAQENWSTRGTYESDEDQNRFDDDDEDVIQRLIRELLEEVNLEGRQVLERLVSKVEKDVRVEKLLRKSLRGFRGKLGSDTLEDFLSKFNNHRANAKSSTSTDRGVDADFLTTEIKMERFKVKTVNVKGFGVVKEEGQ